MTIQQLISVYDQDQRHDVVYPDMIREVSTYAVRHLGKASGSHAGVFHSELDDANADEVIQEQIEYFRSKGLSFEWKWYDYDKPSDLRTRLRQAGFIEEEQESIMVLEMADAPDVFRQPAVHDIREMKSPAHIAHIVSVEEEVWGEDFSWLSDRMGEALSKYPDHIRAYVAYDDGKPVSAAWMVFTQNSEFASLWGGSTLKQYRGRGYYTELLAVRFREALKRGVRFLTVDASEMSRPILQRFGFRVIARSIPFKWQAPPHV